MSCTIWHPKVHFYEHKNSNNSNNPGIPSLPPGPDGGWNSINLEGGGQGICFSNTATNRPVRDESGL